MCWDLLTILIFYDLPSGIVNFFKGIWTDSASGAAAIGLNAGKCKLIDFQRDMPLIEFVYSIDRTALKRVDKIKDLGVIIDSRIEFLTHIQLVHFERLKRVQHNLWPMQECGICRVML
jgi:hypothetical protein